MVLSSAAEQITVNRPDGRVAEFTRPGQPTREVSLMARDTVEIISEEMRRLDPTTSMRRSSSRRGAARVR